MRLTMNWTTRASTSTCRSAKSLVTTAASSTSSGSWISTVVAMRRRDARSGSATPQAIGKRRAVISRWPSWARTELRRWNSACSSIGIVSASSTSTGVSPRAGVPAAVSSAPERRTAPARSAQIEARCDLPAPAGPATTTTWPGQSGQRSTSSTAAAFDLPTTRSSREAAATWPSSSGNCRGFDAGPPIGSADLPAGSAAIERRGEIAGDGEARQHADGGRGGDGDQQAGEAE